MCIEMLKNILSKHNFKTSYMYFSVTYYRAPVIVENTGHSRDIRLFSIIGSISEYDFSVTDAFQDDIKTHFKITISNKL
jgi:hypothetical protein